MTARGQAFTLEAVVAGGVLVASLVFALQVTAVTPLSASTASQHIENQQRASAEGLLASAHERGVLTRTVLYFDESNGEFHNAGSDGYYTTESEVRSFLLGRMLSDAFGSRGVAFNVNLVYHTSSGQAKVKRLVYRGSPSDNAVSASRSVTIYADDNIVEADGTTDHDTTVGTASQLPDHLSNPTGGSSGLHTVVEVEVVLWRM